MAATYSPGTVLFLSSLATRSPHRKVELDPKAFDRKLRVRGPRVLSELMDVPRSLPTLVYQVRIIEAYVPFTMSVVCRVRLIAIFEDSMAAAPFVPLPPETNPHDGGQFDVRPHPASNNEAPGPEYILKLYDRRCFSNIRSAEGEQYSEQGARAYHRYIAGDPAPYFTRWFWDMPGLSEEEVMSENDLGLYEAWLEASAQKMWQKEVAAYNILADLQGRSIPLLFDAVCCSTVFSFPTQTRSHDHVAHRAGLADETRITSDQDKMHVEVPDPSMKRAAEQPFCDRHRVLGILIEYIPGVSLRTFIDRMLRCQDMTRKDVLREIASIGDEAISLVRTIGQYPLVNRDVRIDNMLVRESHVGSLLHNDEFSSKPVNVEPLDSSAQPASAGADLPRCVAIDFGHTRLRFPDETDEQWRCAKLNADEEDNLGRFYQGHILTTIRALRERQEASGGDSDYQEEDVWHYTSSMRWWRDLSPVEKEEYQTKEAWGEHPESWR